MQQAQPSPKQQRASYASVVGGQAQANAGSWYEAQPTEHSTSDTAGEGDEVVSQEATDLRDRLADLKGERACLKYLSQKERRASRLRAIEIELTTTSHQ